MEGAFAEIVSACTGGAALTAWALYLGCSPFVIAVLTALPFLGQFVQIPAAILSSRFGPRRVAIAFVTSSRQVVLPLALLPWLGVSVETKRTILLGLAALSAMLGVVANNAWVAWMAELVPSRVRGRYFGRRTAICTFAGSIASLAVGLSFDAFETHNRKGEALALAVIVASLAGWVTTWLMARQHEPSNNPLEPLAPPERRAGFDVHQAFEPFLDPRARGLLSYQLAWNFALGLSSGLFAVHMLKNMKIGFSAMAAHGTATAAMRVIAAPFWGKTIDRIGGHRVLVACSLGVAILPALWLLPSRYWLLTLCIDPVLSGFFYSGHGLASFALPLAIVPRASRRERPFYIAAFAMSGGAAFALSAAIGGLATALPETFSLAGASMFGLQIVFALTSASRVVASINAAQLFGVSQTPITSRVMTRVMTRVVSRVRSRYSRGVVAKAPQASKGRQAPRAPRE